MGYDVCVCVYMWWLPIVYTMAPLIRGLGYIWAQSPDSNDPQISTAPQHMYSSPSWELLLKEVQTQGIGFVLVVLL